MRFNELLENTIDPTFEQRFRSYFRMDFDDEVSDDIADITFSPDGKINSSAGLTLLLKCQKLPFSFGEVNGQFSILDKGLKTLEGFPNVVGHICQCSSNQLTSLDFAPTSCGEFFAHNNPLVTLRGIPKHVDGSIWFSYSENLGLLHALDLEDFDEFGLMDEIKHREHPVTDIIYEVLFAEHLNYQQKVLLLKRNLIKNGYESNARF